MRIQASAKIAGGHHDMWVHVVVGTLPSDCAAFSIAIRGVELKWM
jgi:hypothetical protein